MHNLNQHPISYTTLQGGVGGSAVGAGGAGAENRLYPFIKPTAPPIFVIGADHPCSCIFCLGDDNAIYSNVLCKCSYYFHKNCFMNYIQRPRNIYNCPLCRSQFIISNYNLTNVFALPANSLGQLENEQEIARQQIMERNRNYHRNRICLTILCCVLFLLVLTTILIVSFTGSSEAWRQH